MLLQEPTKICPFPLAPPPSGPPRTPHGAGLFSALFALLLSEHHEITALLEFAENIWVLPTLGKNLWKKNLFGPKGEVLKGWILLKALSLAVAAGDSSVEAAAAHTKSLLDCYPPDPHSSSNWLQR